MTATLCLYESSSIDCRRPMAEPTTSSGQALERLAASPRRPRRAIVEAATADEVEELRVRYLGRKAELTQILRSISELPPEQRAELGKRGNEARQALEAPDRRSGPRALEARGARAAPARRTASTSRCPATRRSEPATCTC